MSAGNGSRGTMHEETNGRESWVVCVGRARATLGRVRLPPPVALFPFSEEMRMIGILGMGCFLVRRSMLAKMEWSLSRQTEQVDRAILRHVNGCSWSGGVYRYTTRGG